MLIDLSSLLRLIMRANYAMGVIAWGLTHNAPLKRGTCRSCPKTAYRLLAPQAFNRVGQRRFYSLETNG